MHALQQAKRPVTGLAGPYGHPLHPAIVPVPIGAWVASFVFDVASYVVPDPAFLVEASRWLIGIGVLGAVAAAMVGFLDLFAIRPGTRAFRVALIHMGLNLAVTTAYAVGLAIRGGHPSGPIGSGPFVLSAVALAGLLAAGYLGGMLAFRWGVGVVEEPPQADGHEVAAGSGATADTSTQQTSPPSR